MEIKTSEPIARGGSLPDFGAITDRDSEIFSLPVGKPAPQHRRLKNTGICGEGTKESRSGRNQKGLDPVRITLQESKREEIFTNWIDEAMKKMEKDRSIKINQTTLAQLTETAR